MNLQFMRAQCAALFIFSGLAGSTPALANIPNDIGGSWVGTYFCNQGLTNFNLEIEQRDRGQLKATFNFYRHSSTPDVPTGSFLMAGTYDARDGSFSLRGQSWLNRPDGYALVHLNGTAKREPAELRGEVKGGNCTTFSLTRR